MHEKPPECRTHSDESRDEALDRAVRALPRELAPERDLWPALAARLPARRQQRWRRQAGLWAAAAMLGALWLATLPAPVPAPEQASSPMSDLAAGVPVDALLRSVYESEQAAQLATLSAPVLPALAVWDDAIRQVHDALRFYPDDAYLLDQLDRLYRQRLQALQEATLNAAFTPHYY